MNACLRTYSRNVRGHLDYSRHGLGADFGLAVRASDLDEDSDDVAGTPAYIPPELLRREPMTFEGCARADQYSLVVVAYSVVTGVAPFRGRDAVALFHAHLAEMPEAPSTLRRVVPGSLDRVDLRALAKDPAARFPDVAAFGAALTRIRNASGVRARGARQSGTWSAVDLPERVGSRLAR